MSPCDNNRKCLSIHTPESHFILRRNLQWVNLSAIWKYKQIIVIGIIHTTHRKPFFVLVDFEWSSLVLGNRCVLYHLLNLFSIFTCIHIINFTRLNFGCRHLFVVLCQNLCTTGIRIRLHRLECCIIKFHRTLLFINSANCADKISPLLIADTRLRRVRHLRLFGSWPAAG